MSKKLSRRDFLKNAALASAVFASLVLFGQSAKAEGGDKYTPGTYTAEKTISYAEISVSMTFSATEITACEIKSSGGQDLPTEELKAKMAAAIVEGQGADVDAVTSCTLVASVGAIQECVAGCIAQATGTEIEVPETKAVTGREIGRAHV